MNPPAIVHRAAEGARDVWGWAAFFPLFGFPIGFLAIICGSVKYRRGGRRLLVLGLTGILCGTVVPYGALLYFGYGQRAGVFDALRAKEMQDDLNLAVKLIEFFKISHGHYPISLEELDSSLPEGSQQKRALRDPRWKVQLGMPQFFYYQLVDERHYYLRAVGVKGEPFSSTSIAPSKDLRSGNVGLLSSP